MIMKPTQFYGFANDVAGILKLSLDSTKALLTTISSTSERAYQHLYGRIYISPSVLGLELRLYDKSFTIYYQKELIARFKAFPVSISELRVGTFSSFISGSPVWEIKSKDKVFYLVRKSSNEKYSLERAVPDKDIYIARDLNYFIWTEESDLLGKYNLIIESEQAGKIKFKTE